MISANKLDFGLRPGDELIQCSKGFTWNQTIHSMGAHVPDKVIVVKEYQHHIVVRAYFEKNGGKSYTESINKLAYLCGDCYFQRMPKYE